MKTIIYATDCSTNDASALKYAYRFSSIMNADLHVLHVYELPPITFSTIRTPESLKNRFHNDQIDLLDKYCKKHLKNEFNKHPITTHVIESDNVSKSIKRLSKTVTPDVIIIGMKDKQSTRGFFSGNIANDLLDHVEVPVLMVPNNLVYDTISTIVYATDFEKKDIQCVKKLVEIAQPFSALIEVLHIYKTNEESAKKYMEQFKELVFQQVSYKDITFKTIASTKIKSGLLSVLNNEKASMLAMLERKHDWSYQSFFRKDVVKEMQDHIAIPLLAFSNNGPKTKGQNVNTLNTKNELAF